MVYTADRHIFVTAGGEIIDPSERPGESAFLLVAPGQSLPDEQAEALGLSGGGRASGAALMQHVRGSAGTFTTPGTRGTPGAPGGGPGLLAMGEAAVSKPGGHRPGDVDHVMLFSGVSRSTAEFLAEADRISAAGYESQIQTEVALREQSRESAPRQLGKEGSVETTPSTPEPGAPGTVREAQAEVSGVEIPSGEGAGTVQAQRAAGMDEAQAEASESVETESESRPEYR